MTAVSLLGLFDQFQLLYYPPSITYQLPLGENARMSRAVPIEIQEVLRGGICPVGESSHQRTQIYPLESLQRFNSEPSAGGVEPTDICVEIELLQKSIALSMLE